MPNYILNHKLYHDRTVQNWHRKLPDNCHAIDLDLVGICEDCRAWLYLIEGATYWDKPTTAIRWAANTLNIPAFLVVGRDDDIEGGMMIMPKRKRYDPDALADVLLKIRKYHHSRHHRY